LAKNTVSPANNRPDLDKKKRAIKARFALQTNQLKINSYDIFLENFKSFLKPCVCRNHLNSRKEKTNC